MGFKEEMDFHKWRKAESAATKRRLKAQKPDRVCVICGNGYYEHESYGEVEEHRKMLEGKRQWVKK
jgi:hypothetical protein